MNYKLRCHDLTRNLLFSFYHLSENPIIIFGNQKSGTSAIAGLLGAASGLSYSLDVPSIYKQKNFEELINGQKKLDEIIQKYGKIEFSRDLIKEPSLTFIYQQVKELYSDSPKVFIIRNPLDNIRSILNRVDIAGNLISLRREELSHLPSNWENIVFNDFLGISYDSYIESLAKRWNLVADVYVQQSNDFILIKYEDFLADKVGTILHSCGRLNLEVKNDISEMVDIQFQPPGRNIEPKDFFGKINFEIIRYICKDRMKAFNYH